MHRFRATSCFSAENLVFAHPTCIWPWIWRSYGGTMETKFGIRKLESWGWWRNRARRSIHVGTVHECDSQTDGQTDWFTISKTALCIVSRGKNTMILSAMIMQVNKNSFSIFHCFSNEFICAFSIASLEGKQLFHQVNSLHFVEFVECNAILINDREGRLPWLGW